nr:MAG TPA: hypothetical protein [Caudoviricetes sp.]
MLNNFSSFHKKRKNFFQIFVDKVKKLYYNHIIRK